MKAKSSFIILLFYPVVNLEIIVFIVVFLCLNNRLFVHSIV